MATVAGELREITRNHPELGMKVYKPKGGEDFMYDLGGIRSTDDANMITSDGEMIDQMKTQRWFVEGPIAFDRVNRMDLESLQAEAAHPIPSEYTFEHMDGTVYAATGKPVGDIQGNTGAGTIDVKFSGGGILEKQ